MDNRKKQTTAQTKIPYHYPLFKPNPILLRRAIPIGGVFTAEQALHPIDVAIRRSQVSSLKMNNLANIQKAIFLNSENASLFTNINSLYAGFASSGAYRLLSRVIKFVGQEELEKKLDQRFSPQISKTFGEQNTRIILKSLSGGTAGLAEVMLHPLDTIKNKQQLLDSRSVIQISKQEGKNLFNGIEAATIKASLNAAVGFGTYGAMLNRMGNPKNPTSKQQAKASVAAGFAASLISNPFDIVKNRLQLVNGKANHNTLSMLKNILKQEGLSAFGKGMLLKSARTTASFAVPLFLFSLFTQYQKDHLQNNESLKLENAKRTQRK